MQKFMPMLKLDKISEGAAGGATPPAKPPSEPTTPTPPAPPEAGGDNLDDLGYEKIAPEPGAPPADPNKPAEKPATPPAAAPPAKVETPATGYGAEPPKVEDPPAAPAAPATPPTPPDEMDKALEGLPKEELGKVKEFATKNAMTVVQAKAYADLRKQELVDAQAHAVKQQKDFDAEKIRIRAEWHKELKTDPVFGGEKFDHNVSKAEKVLEDFLPSIKKSLTERKAMLPPDHMRDLAKLADTLYAAEKLVQGDPAKPAETVVEDDDGTAFYKS